MRAQEFDAFALRSYSFAVRKTNSYFSITTLILTAAIITVSMFININSLSHLWLPLDQLPRLSANSLSFPKPLTSSLVCYKSTVNNSQMIPKIRVLDSNMTLMSFRQVSSDVIQKSRPLLAKKLGSYFGCLNIQGLTFSQTNFTFYFQVDSASASLYVESITEAEILGQQESIWLEFNATTKFGFLRLIRAISASIQNNLMTNSAPIKREMIYYDKDTQKILGASGNLQSMGIYSTFVLKTFLPSFEKSVTWTNYNLIELTVTRLDFGAILGGVLSWVSILGLLCSLLAGPVMEKALQLLQAEALFLLPERLRAPSLLRFMFAPFGPVGLFRKERAFLALSERLEQLKDVAKTLKIVRTIRKVTPKTTQTETEIMASENHFGHQQSLDLGISVFQQNKNQQNCFEDTQNFPKENLLSRCRKSLFHWLDSGSDTISVNYSKNGHGSAQSLCLSILFIIGFFAFLTIFGVFNFQTATTIYQTKSDDQALTYDLNYNEIILATNQDAQIIALLLDGNYNTRSTLSLTNLNCLTNLTAQQIAVLSSYTYIYCFSEDLTLSQSNNPNEVISLYISNKNFQISSINVYHFSPPSPTIDYNPNDNFVSTIFYVDGIDTYIEQNIKLTSLSYQGSIDSTFAQFTLAKKTKNAISQLAGINIVLNNIQTIIDYSQNTFFDIIQTIWGFAIICFTILLMKLTKYINLKQKEKNITLDRMEFRDSLCILLSKIDGLANGRHGEELRRMRYFVKDPLLQ